MKKLTVLMLVVVMVLGLMLIVVVAGGPANRATGLVWLNGRDGDIHVEFDAHMTMAGRPAKGSVFWYRYGVLRVELDVICCNVVGNIAWFATVPTYLDVGVNPIYGDQFLFFKVVDGGTPGDNGDALSVQWIPDRDDACSMVENQGEPSGVYTIIGGNLVVHYYEE